MEATFSRARAEQVGAHGSIVKELQAWLDRRAQHDTRIPYLDDVFLTGRFAPYAWYRLRLFFLRWFAASVVHILRVVLLAAAFSRQDFIQLLLAEAVVGFLSSFWWGALESMRERIRDLRRQASPFSIPREIERWLMLSWALAAAAVIACLVWLVVRRGRFGPFELYAVGLAVRLALQFVTRTFHSGAYAMRRIYRPGWAVVAVDVLSFGAVVLAWPVLGAWALPIATLAAAVTGSAITLYFTHRMYRFMGVLPRWGAADAFRQRWRVSWVTAAASGLSFAVMKLDAVLVFGLFDHRGGSGADPDLLVLLFVMAPTIQAGFDWAYLFYFDLKRLHVTPLAPLLAEFRRKVTRLAYLMGVLFWLLGSATGAVVFLGGLGWVYGLLGPFFVSRALAASAQIQAFSARRYGILLGTSLLWLAGFEAARRIDSDAGKLAAITLATVAVYVALGRLARPAAAAEGNLVGAVEWLRLLGAIQRDVRIGSALLRPLRTMDRQPRAASRGLAWSRRQFARTLARRLGRSGAVAIVRSDRIIWFELAGGRELRPTSIAALSGGIAQAVRLSAAHSSGREAAAAAWNEHRLDAVFGGLPVDGVRPPGAAELEQTFTGLFPGGWIFTPGRPPRAPGIPGRWRRGVIHAARRFVDELTPPRGASPIEVTALSVSGQLRLVFVAGTRTRSAYRRTWRATIRRANVTAALNGGDSSPQSV